MGVLGDFFVAGTETTSSILRWALVYLVNFQELQEQMYNSIKVKTRAVFTALVQASGSINALT